MSVGSNIRQRRELREVSQKELAKRIGITPAGLCMIESGKRLPSLPNLAKIATVLGTTPGKLMK